MSWFVIEECSDPTRNATGRRSAVACTDCPTDIPPSPFRPRVAQAQAASTPNLLRREWKHWWAVTEADRLRLRVEIDALCADLYGLDPDDFDWIVRDDRTDPKGFYRVDRQLPFRERLTGLAAAAFRALKEGRWSAESAATLSNDEFFEILGIPELTNPRRPSQGPARSADPQARRLPRLEARELPPGRPPPRLDLGRLLERRRGPPRQRGGGAKVHR